jgi:hypothetical protein
VKGLSEEYRAETAAAIEKAVRRAHVPLRIWLAGAGLMATLVLGAIFFFVRGGPATIIIQVPLPPGVDVRDTTLSFFLDGKAVPGEELEKPIKLDPGDHELLIKRGDVQIKRVKFAVLLKGRQVDVQVKDTTAAEEPVTPERLVFDHPLSKTDTLDHLYRFLGIYTSQVAVVPGNGLRLTAGFSSPVVWAKPFVGDRYRVQFDAQLEKNAWAGWLLNGPGYANCAGAGYFCRFDREKFWLNREGVEAQAIKLPRQIVPGEWVAVEANVDKGKITVTIDGQPIPPFTDAEPLSGPLHGWFGLIAGTPAAETRVVYRNLRIWSSAPDTNRARQLARPGAEKPLANGRLLYELKLAGDLGPEWWKSQPGDVAVENGALALCGHAVSNGTPTLVLTRPLPLSVACDVEFEYPTESAVGLAIMFMFAKKAPQAARDCVAGWRVVPAGGDGKMSLTWHGPLQGGSDRFDTQTPALVSTPYHVPIPHRKYVARMELQGDTLRVFLDDGLVMTGKRPGGAQLPEMPLFLGIRQYFNAVKIHAVRTYQILEAKR